MWQVLLGHGWGWGGVGKQETESEGSRTQGSETKERETDEEVAIPYSRESSAALAGGFFTPSATWEALMRYRDTPLKIVGVVTSIC